VAVLFDKRSNTIVNFKPPSQNTLNLSPLAKKMFEVEVQPAASDPLDFDSVPSLSVKVTGVPVTLTVIFNVNISVCGATGLCGIWMLNWGIGAAYAVEAAKSQPPKISIAIVIRRHG
jgi:hypothetical protein